MSLSQQSRTLPRHDSARSELAQLFQAILKAKGADIPSQEVYDLLEKPPEQELGDFALPCFRFAKALRRAPQQIAAELVEAARQSVNPWIGKIDAVGAFANVFVDQRYLAEQLLPKIISGDHFEVFSGAESKTRVMVEFSQPNTHKEFHVGHGRNVCLGDVVCRLFRYTGYQVVPVNYIGDEGTHVAKCLWQVKKEKPFGGSGRPGADWYGKCYANATTLLNEADEEQKRQYHKEISAILAELEAKKGPYFELWKSSREDCLSDFEKVYGWLGVQFEHVFYESELTDEAQAIVDEYLDKGLFKVSEGAVGIDMEPHKLGFFMARKSDGSTLYMTKDLALARRKFRDFAIDRSIYVVGSEQNFHFQQLFKALELMGFEQSKLCHHLSYAHVKLPSGKMSSRAGNIIAFRELIDLLKVEVHSYLEKRKGEWSGDEIEATCHKIALGALRYGMLVSDPGRDIVFDPKAWTSFEGHSGVYLMYSYTRTNSIIEKCEQRGFAPAFDRLDCLDKASERELLRALYDFNQVIHVAAETYRPSTLCNHLYHTAKAFNRFYSESSVLNATESHTRSARMALVCAFAKTLHVGLGLLGIEPPKRM